MKLKIVWDRVVAVDVALGDFQRLRRTWQRTTGIRSWRGSKRRRRLTRFAGRREARLFGMFRSAADIGREHPGGVGLLRDGGTWNTLAGQPTDDSEMALILARSIVQEGGYTPAAAAHAYAWWYKSHPFDIGNTTRTALAPKATALGVGQQPAEEARKHANRESQANGALMRVSPLGILAAGAERSAAIRWAKEDAALTHPNSVCQDASAVFASAVAFAIRTGESPQAVYS